MTHRAPRLIVAALGQVAVGTLAACNDDTDCGGGFICSGSGYTNIPDTFCGDLCTREADCATTGRSWLGSGSR